MYILNHTLASRKVWNPFPGTFPWKATSTQLRTFSRSTPKLTESRLLRPCTTPRGVLKPSFARPPDQSPSLPPHTPHTPHPLSVPARWRPRWRLARARDAEAGPADAPYGVRAPLGARARVFGPERVVLDPRIRRAHRRVLRDILSFGALAGTVLTVVVLVLPHARGVR